MLYVWRTAEMCHAFSEMNMREMSFFWLDCVNFDIMKMQDRLDESHFKRIYNYVTWCICGRAVFSF